MKRSTKIWLLSAIVFILVGIIGSFVILNSADWDLNQLSTQKIQRKSYAITEKFNSIYLETDIANVCFTYSTDGQIKVDCYENEKATHKVNVKDGVLTIKLNDTRTWYEKISIVSTKTPTVTVYLPYSSLSSLTVKATTSDVAVYNCSNFENIDIKVNTGYVICSAPASKLTQISTTTGDIDVKKVRGESMKLSTSTGDISIKNVSCANDITANTDTGDITLDTVSCSSFLSTANTGDLEMNSVTASSWFSIKRSTGDVAFNRCNAFDISIETDTGDVTGSLLYSKAFKVKSNTGKVSVPKFNGFGKCNITTDTGDIIIEVTGY